MAITIKTNQGKTFDADLFFFFPRENACEFVIQDNRRLADIAQDFDGLTSIQVSGTAPEPKIYEGYNRLTRMQLIKDGVKIRIEKGDE